jgi:hypothetical protein
VVLHAADAVHGQDTRDDADAHAATVVAAARSCIR